MLAPAVVMSAPKKVEAVSEAQREAGNGRAPAIAQAVGITVEVTDARLVGKQVDAKTKVSTSYYEIGLRRGLGYPLSARPAAPSRPPSPASKPTPRSRTASLRPCPASCRRRSSTTSAPLLAKGGVTCTPEAARGIGQSATNTFLEVACQGGQGFVVQAGARHPRQPGRGQ